MTGLDRAAAADALAGAYGKITQFVGGLTEADAMLPSRCAGWTVLDVLYHQLLDARRALVTFASPSPDPPGTDYVTYWRPYAPASGRCQQAGMMSLARSRGPAASPSPRPTSRPSDRPQAGFPSSAERTRPGPVSYKASSVFPTRRFKPLDRPFMDVTTGVNG